MKNVWKPLAVVSAFTFLLAGCNAPIEEQIEKGLVSAETTFTSEAIDATEKIGDIEVYMPSGYKIEESSADMNYTVTKGDDQYILFVNTLEQEDSQLHYDLLKKEQGDKIVEEQTYMNDSVFGFTAVIQEDEERFTLVVSNGGIKMTTLTDGKKIDHKLQAMMEIVRSVKVK